MFDCLSYTLCILLILQDSDAAYYVLSIHLSLLCRFSHTNNPNHLNVMRNVIRCCLAVANFAQILQYSNSTKLTYTRRHWSRIYSQLWWASIDNGLFESRQIYRDVFWYSHNKVYDHWAICIVHVFNGAVSVECYMALFFNLKKTVITNNFFIVFFFINIKVFLCQCILAGLYPRDCIGPPLKIFVCSYPTLWAHLPPYRLVALAWGQE